jgi:hypothetical protein
VLVDWFSFHFLEFQVLQVTASRWQAGRGSVSIYGLWVFRRASVICTLGLVDVDLGVRNVTSRFESIAPPAASDRILVSLDVNLVVTSIAKRSIADGALPLIC